MKYGVGIAVVCVLVVLGAGAVAAGAVSRSVGSDEPESRTFRGPGKGRTLALDVESSRLEVVPAAAGVDDVKVTRWFKATKVVGNAETKWSQESGGEREIRLHTKCTGFMVNCTARYKVAVPEGLDLRVRGGSGTITAREAPGAVDVETDNGGVEVRKAAGAVRARSDNGGVTVEDVQHAVDLGTSNGSVEVRRTHGPLRLETDNGRIRTREVDATKVRARADNGSVDLELAKAPRLVDARTDNGKITIALPTDGLAYDVHARTDNGGKDVTVPEKRNSKHRITTQTSNGGITVRPLD